MLKTNLWKWSSGLCVFKVLVCVWFGLVALNLVWDGMALDRQTIPLMAREQESSKAYPPTAQRPLVRSPLRGPGTSQQHQPGPKPLIHRSSGDSQDPNASVPSLVTFSHCDLTKTPYVEQKKETQDKIHKEEIEQKSLFITPGLSPCSPAPSQGNNQSYVPPQSRSVHTQEDACMSSPAPLSSPRRWPLHFSVYSGMVPGG